MSRYQHLTLLLCSAVFLGTRCRAVPAAGLADVAEIVRRTAVTIRADWAAAPEYAFLQRDESEQSGKQTSKTHQVVMIAGSDYYMPVAIDDQPLPQDRQKSELEKLRNEVDRRNKEDPQARQRRTENYRKQRQQNGELMIEFPNAFNFDLGREETIDGHMAYVLPATPRQRSGPTSRVAKILAGMGGQLWVDEDSFHMIRAESDVITPVSIFGIFARVMPGTHMEIEMTPVSDSVWLASRFSMTVEISKFLFFHSTQVTRSSYSEYRLNGPVLDELLAKAGE